MDEVLSGPEIVEKVYLLDIIQPLGLLAWLVLGFSLLILLVGGRLLLYNFLAITILTAVEDTIPPRGKIGTANEEEINPSEGVVATNSTVAANVDGENEPLLRRIVSQEGGLLQPQSSAPTVAQIIIRNIATICETVKSASKSIWQVLRGTGRRTDHLWGIEKYLFQECGASFAFPGVGIYIAWIGIYYPFKVLLNLVINSIVFLVHFLCQVTQGTKWEDFRGNRSKFPGWYEPLFVPMTGISGFVITVLSTSLLVSMIRVIVYFDYLQNHSPKPPRKWIPFLKWSFPNRPTLLAAVLYATASEVALNLPVIAIRDSRLPPNGPWKPFTHTMISAITYEWMAYLLLYLFLVLPAVVYLSRVAVIPLPIEDDSVVQFEHVTDTNSYSKVMQGFGWKGWLRLAKMQVKMMAFLLIFFSSVGAIFSLELRAFGIWEESRNWFIARYLYFEGGYWEALSNSLFWLRVAILWS